MIRQENTAYNSSYTQAGVSCFYESEVLNPGIVLLMKFSGKNPCLRVAANRYSSPCHLTNRFVPRFELNLSVPLVLEYEEVLLRMEPTLNFRPEEIGKFLDYLCRIANLHEVHFLWRPILNDPMDDMI